MSPTGWTTVLMTAAILLPALLLLLAYGAARFGDHPAVLAFNQRLSASLERHRLAWAVVVGVGFFAIGIVQWRSRQFPTGLIFGPIYGWMLWKGLLTGQPSWLLGSLDDDFADVPEPEPPAPLSPGPPPLPSGRIWNRPDRPPSAAELRRRARGQRMKPVDR